MDDEESGAGCAAWAWLPTCTRRCQRCRACKRCCGGLRRQPLDARDHTWARALPHEVPRAYTLPNMPAALDQGPLAACAVNACANALAMCMEKRGFPSFRASRMFLYYNARVHIMKVASRDTGCNLRDVCKAACKYGVCEEKMWPYSPELLKKPPPSHLYHAAKRLPAFQYKSVPQTVRGIVSCLLHGHPVLLGISLYKGVHDVARTGVLAMPRVGEPELGRHAVMLCGYDMGATTFKAQNCWGASWGDRGSFNIPFAYVLHPSLCWDFWVVV